MNKRRFMTWVALSVMLVGCSGSERPGLSPSGPAVDISPPPDSAPSASPSSSPQASSTPQPDPSEPSAPTASAPVPFSPQYLPTSSLGFSASKFFQIQTPTGVKVAWQNRHGNLTIFQQGSQLDMLGFNPALKNAKFVSGTWEPMGKSLLIVREEEPRGNPDYPYSINSRAIVLENKLAIQNKVFPKLQVHSTGLDAEGNGYILLSDEYPQSVVSDEVAEPMRLYASKVEKFIPSEPRVLFTTDVKSRYGIRATLEAVIDQKGSGFFIHWNAKGQAVLRSFTQLTVDADAQALDVVDGYEFSLSKTATGFVFTYFNQKPTSPTSSKTSQYINIHPLKNYRFEGPSYTYELPTKVNLLRRKVFVTPEGKGLLASIEYNERKETASLSLQAITDFQLQAAQDFAYSTDLNLTLYDFVISVDPAGNGHLFFENVVCHSVDCNSGNFDLSQTPLQVSYVTLKGFALQ